MITQADNSVTPDPARWLVPQPKRMTRREGIYRGPVPLAFHIPPGCDLSEPTIRLSLNGRAPLQPAAHPHPPDKGLRLELGDPGGADTPETYHLTVSEDHITVTALHSDGLLMGLRTLAMLAMEGPIPQCDILDWPDFETRGAHLCYHMIRESLPYNAPNFNALLRQIDRFAALKYNTILLELESMFPYRRHPAITCGITFSPHQIAALNDRFIAHRLRVIPMVQCLGHAYNVLEHERYAAYRELPGTCQQYCPTNPNCRDLYEEFVDEYLDVFHGVTRWHIGGDEARQLGQCPRCRQKVERDGIARLYVEHINDVARRIHDRGVTPIVWGDMLEKTATDHVEEMPEYLQFAYWNYDYPNWPRPYAIPQLSRAGHRVIAAPAVRWGAAGNELALHYPPSMRGIETLLARAHQDGCRELLLTNWTKGSPHELADFGFAYGADVGWSVNTDREQFQRRYAKLTFGLDDSAVCGVFDDLSLWLPYAEPVQNHQEDELNRLDVSGFRFREKLKHYTDPDHEPEALAQLEAGRAGAWKARATLECARRHSRRGQRLMDVMALSADCIDAKARLALGIHLGHYLTESVVDDTEVVLRWCSDFPAVVGRWRACRDRHRAMLAEDGFEPAVRRLNDMMFEPAELEHLQALGITVAGLIEPGLSPAAVAIPYLDNPGEPYERGVAHGRAFRDEIRKGIAHWCGNRSSNGRREAWFMQRMYRYVDDRFPQITLELRGIADGAGVTLDEIQWLNAFNALGNLPAAAGCSSMVLTDTAGRTRLVNTSDIDPDQRRMMVLRRVLHGDRQFHVLGWVGTVWPIAALTRSGLAVSFNSAPVQPNQTGQGIPQHLGTYPLLFSADTVEQAIEQLSRIDFAGKGLLIALADAAGDGAVVEKSGNAQAVRRMKGGAILGANDFVTPDMRAYNATQKHELIENCESRRKRFAQWLDEIGGRPGDDEAIERLLAEKPFSQDGACGMTTEAAILICPQTRELRLTGLTPRKHKYITWRLGNPAPADLSPATPGAHPQTA